VVEAELADPKAPVQGKPYKPGDPVPPGHHRVKYFYSGKDFHMTTLDTDGEWSEKTEDEDADEDAGYKNGSPVGEYVINTPPRHGSVAD
jgi:hypothetical protein